MSNTSLDSALIHTPLGGLNIPERICLIFLKILLTLISASTFANTPYSKNLVDVIDLELEILMFQKVMQLLTHQQTPPGNNIHVPAFLENVMFGLRKDLCNKYLICLKYTKFQLLFIRG